MNYKHIIAGLLIASQVALGSGFFGSGGSSSGGGTWGSITGTLSNQTDLQTELSSKVADGGTPTDNAIVRWDGTSGTAVQNSAVVIDDSNNITGVESLAVNGQTGFTNVGILNDAWATTTPSLKVSGTIPNTAGTYYGSQFTFPMTAGSEIRALRGLYLQAGTNGNTGASDVTGIMVSLTSGANNDLAGQGGAQPQGNVGVYGLSADSGNADDDHAGVWGEGFSNVRAVGVVGGAIGTNAAFTNRVGVIGYAHASNATGDAMGGYFYLFSDASSVNGTENTDLFPAYEAALVANNGGVAAPVFQARDNGNLVFEIGDQGIIKTNQPVADTSAIPANAVYKMPIYNGSSVLLGYVPIVADF